MNREQFIKDVIEVGCMPNVRLSSGVTIDSFFSSAVVCCPFGAAFYKMNNFRSDSNEGYPSYVFAKVTQRYQLSETYKKAFVSIVDGIESHLDKNSEDYKAALEDVNILFNIFTFKV